MRPRSFKGWFIYLFMTSLSCTMFMFILAFVAFAGVFDGQVSLFSGEGFHLYLAWLSAISNMGLQTYVNVVAAFATIIVAVQVTYSRIQVRGFSQGQEKAVRAFREKERYQTVLVISTVALTVYSLVIILNFFVDLFVALQKFSQSGNNISHIAESSSKAQQINENLTSVDIWKLIFPVLFIVVILWYICNVLEPSPAEEELIREKNNSHIFSQRIDNLQKIYSSIHISGINDNSLNKNIRKQLIIKNLIFSFVIGTMFVLGLFFVGIGIIPAVIFAFIIICSMVVVFYSWMNKIFFNDRLYTVAHVNLMFFIAALVLGLDLDVYLNFSLTPALLLIAYEIIFVLLAVYLVRKFRQGKTVNSWVVGSSIMYKTKKDCTKEITRLNRVITEAQKTRQKNKEDTSLRHKIRQSFVGSSSQDNESS